MRANIDLNRCDVERHASGVFDVQFQTSHGFVQSTRDDLKAGEEFPTTPLGRTEHRPTKSPSSVSLRLRLVRKREGSLLSCFEQLVGKSGIGNGAGELQGADQRSKNRLRYLDIWIGEHRFDVGNHSTELSGERAPRRLRMSSDFRPERRRWTAPLGMFTMARSQVSPNEGLDPTLFGGLDNPCKAFLHARFDDFLNQRLLRGEVAVEATVC